MAFCSIILAFLSPLRLGSYTLVRATSLYEVRSRPEGVMTDEKDGGRLDRELIELLNELRVALPGVQVLFAFLLTVPFTQRFTTLTTTQEKIYYATLLCTTASTILLIAPSAHHRINFRQQDKAYIVFLANRMTIAGLGLLALAMSGVVFLITDVLYGSTATAFA